MGHPHCYTLGCPCGRRVIPALVTYLTLRHALELFTIQVNFSGATRGAIIGIVI